MKIVQDNGDVKENISREETDFLDKVSGNQEKEFTKPLETSDNAISLNQHSTGKVTTNIQSKNRTFLENDSKITTQNDTSDPEKPASGLNNKLNIDPNAEPNSQPKTEPNKEPNTKPNTNSNTEEDADIIKAEHIVSTQS